MGTKARALLARRNTRPPNDAEIDTEITDVFESMLNEIYRIGNGNRKSFR